MPVTVICVGKLRERFFADAASFSFICFLIQRNMFRSLL